MKYAVLTASMILQMCIGGIYAWSVFVPPLQTSYNFSASQTQWIFSTTIFCFTVTMIFAGRLLKKFSPTSMVAAGGIFFLAGYLIASFSGGSFPIMLLGIGLIAGIGIGCCYICPIAVCVRHFPEKKGLVTGIAVAGFGGGAVLLVYLAEMLFHSGYDVLYTLRLVGISYGALIILSGFFIRFPKCVTRESLNDAPHFRFATFSDRRFLLILLGMFTGTFSGLMLIGNLKTVISNFEVSETLADMAVALFAVGNSSGRILWGIIHDKIQLKAVSLSLIIFSASVLLLVFTGHIAPLALLFSFLCGTCFGACFVLYVSETAECFGHDSIATIYPIIFMVAYGFGGSLGPIVGGISSDIFGTFKAPLILVAAMLGIGASIIKSKLWHKAQQAPTISTTTS